MATPQLTPQVHSPALSLARALRCVDAQGPGFLLGSRLVFPWQWGADACAMKELPRLGTASLPRAKNPRLPGNTDARFPGCHLSLPGLLRARGTWGEMEPSGPVPSEGDMSQHAAPSAPCAGHWGLQALRSCLGQVAVSCPILGLMCWLSGCPFMMVDSSMCQAYQMKDLRMKKFLYFYICLVSFYCDNILLLTLTAF